jgi:hypothetical protein
MRTLIFLVMYITTHAFSQTLENRVVLLEKKVMELQNLNKTKNGLKVKDMGHKKMNSNKRTLSSYSKESPQLSKEKQKEIMDQIKIFKAKREESQKLLDELMKDEF